MIVSFNSARHLEALASRFALRPGDYEDVLVVDNASSDSSVLVGRAAGLRVHRSPDNLGYGRAFNLGVRLLGRCDWYVALNPDVEITSTALSSMLAGAPAHAGIVSPLLVTATGEAVADIFRPPPSPIRTARLYLLSARRPWPTRRARPDTGARYVSTATTSGACLALRHAALHQCGGFDEAFFLCLEDVELCARVRDGGWTVAVDTQTRALHHKGTSSAGAARSDWRLETARAEITITALRHGRLATIAVAVAVAVGVTGREAIEALAARPLLCGRPLARRPSQSGRPARSRLGKLALVWNLAAATAARRCAGLAPLRPAGAKFIDA